MTNTPARELAIETTQGHAGILRRESQYVFNYGTAHSACQVAIGMPLRHESYAGNVLPGAFTQNLPEGYLLRRIQLSLARHEKLTDMRLLAMLGNRQIGRLQFHEPGKPMLNTETVDLGELLHGGRSPQLFEYLINRFMASGISGVQPKVLASNSALPQGKSAITAPDLIIKSAGNDFPFLTQNEYLCMSAARRAGILVPEFWLSDDNGLFVLRRFDLAADGPLGFEDMATILGQQRDSTGDYKYRGSYEAIARAVGLLSRNNLKDLFEYVALSVLLRNGDAHLKNFGLLYKDPSQPASIRLSPLYDVVTTTLYSSMTYQSDRPVIDRTLALKLDRVKAYPNHDRLMAFGRQHCLVDKPGEVIERLLDAMQETLTTERSRFQEAPEFARLEREWQAGATLSGQPLQTRIAVSSPEAKQQRADVLREKAAQAVSAFWQANPLLQDILQQLLNAGHEADAPWHANHPTHIMLIEIRRTAGTDVLLLEQRASRAVSAMLRGK
jgi:serine/threonine-protein kinase HipA